MSERIDEILDGIDGVLFDMDGVLLDTEALYTEATRRVLGVDHAAFDFKLKEKMMGRAPWIATRLLLEAVGSPMTPEEFDEKKRPVLFELFRESKPKAHAPELVELLHARGIPLAVASSSDRRFFEAKTSHHPWFSHFRAAICGNDPGVRRHKPAPDVFLEAARSLGVSSTRCLVFEDSPAGVEAARRARAKRVVAIVDPRLDRSLIPSAHLVIESYLEILGPRNVS